MKIKTLDEITSKIGSGATPRGGNSAYKSEGISLIRSQNVYDFSFSKNGLAFIDNTQAKKLNNVTVIEGDILLNITGDSIARTCVVPKDILPARVNQHVSIIRCKAEYNSKFVNYYLINLKSYLMQICGVGGTRNALTKEAIQKLEIRIPNSQKLIAKVLSDLDAKIEVNNKINQELEAMAKTLYDYWFVQFDFPDETGKPYKSSGGKMVYNEELKREIPEGWEIERLSKSTQIVDCLHSKKSDYFFESDDNYLLQLENIKDDGLIDLTNKYYVSKLDYERWTTRIEVQDHDLVITNAGRVAGLAQIPNNLKAGIGRNITAIRPIGIEPTFLYYTFQGAEMKRQIKLNTDTGSFFKSLNVRGIKELIAIRPPKALERKFEEIALTHRRKRELNSIENQKLSELRDWLLPMLMNGQVTVGETEAALGMVAEESEKYN